MVNGECTDLYSILLVDDAVRIKLVRDHLNPGGR
jgi:hypothetical protein